MTVGDVYSKTHGRDNISIELKLIPYNANGVHIAGHARNEDMIALHVWSERPGGVCERSKTGASNRS